MMLASEMWEKETRTRIDVAIVWAWFVCPSYENRIAKQEMKIGTMESGVGKKGRRYFRMMNSYRNQYTGISSINVLSVGGSKRKQRMSTRVHCICELNRLDKVLNLIDEIGKDFSLGINNPEIKWRERKYEEGKDYSYTKKI